MRCRLFVFCFPLLCAFLNSQQIQAQNSSTNQSLNRFLDWTFNDPVHVIKDIDQSDIGTFLLAGIGVAGISAHDSYSSGLLQARFSDSRYLTTTNEVGTFKYVAPLSAALFGTSLLTDNTKFQDAAFTSLQSVLYTHFTVNAAKFVFARERPDHFEGPYDFEFFEGSATSFPSGHTSTAFALIVPWAVYYPNAVTYSMLALPVSTAIARVAKGRHWVSDVTAGALIGAYWGYKLSKRHLNVTKNNDSIDIAPFFGQNSGGISLKVSF
jgi:undecaprenyl-diphosphatase